VAGFGAPDDKIPFPDLIHQPIETQGYSFNFPSHKLSISPPGIIARADGGYCRLQY
jgi:hypothetical protein